MNLILSCEHAGNRVPAQWAHLFGDDCAALTTHRGYDPGTMELGKFFADSFGVDLHWTDVTRLLVDCNRSLGHRRLFSEWSSALEKEEKRQVLEQYYHPHRQLVMDSVESMATSSRVAVHIGVHSFTPVWDGQTRRVDVGFLYDPARREEQAFCRRWQQLLRERVPGLRVRCNQPYLGKADGLTTFLRRRFSADRYLGIELEINQAIVAEGGERWQDLQQRLLESLRELKL